MSDQETPLFTKIYRLSINLYKTNKKMPKRDRYLYGERIESTLQEILENVILATNTSKITKLSYLKPASRKLELLKVQLRLANEMGLLNAKKYLEFEAELREAGRMLGGWIRYQSPEKLPGGHQCLYYDPRD